MATGYRIGSHSEDTGLTPALARLAAAAFAEYDGTALPTRGFIAWYRKRPGMDAALCRIARAPGAEIVSSVFATRMPLSVGGRSLRAVVIDTVMTAPRHRGRGLASRLLESVHEAARDEGRDLALLFTGAGSEPARLYGRLGYRVVAHLSCLQGARPEVDDGAAARMHHTVSPAAIAQLNHALAAQDGFRPYTEEYALWLADGPSGRRAYAIHDTAGALEASVQFSRVDLRLGSRVQRMAVVSDAWGAMSTEVARRLLAASPASRVLWLCDAADGPLKGAVHSVGLTETAQEVAMALAFTDAANEALASPSALWYPMLESIIGV